MHTMFERGAKARLSFSGGPHAPVNMADSMENAGSWTVSGSKEAMEVPKNSKNLQKLGIQNIAQCSNCVISCIFFHQHSLLPYYPPCLQEKLRPLFGAVLVHSAHDCETDLFSPYLAQIKFLCPHLGFIAFISYFNSFNLKAQH